MAVHNAEVREEDAKDVEKVVINLQLNLSAYHAADAKMVKANANANAKAKEYTAHAVSMTAVAYTAPAQATVAVQAANEASAQGVFAARQAAEAAGKQVMDAAKAQAATAANVERAVADLQHDVLKTFHDSDVQGVVTTLQREASKAVETLQQVVLTLEYAVVAILQPEVPNLTATLR